MENLEVNQTEAQWTEREKQLAERFNVPLEKVRQVGDLCGDLAERLLQSQADRGQEAETPEPEIPESPGDLRVKTIKRWMQQRTYTEKLAAITLWQLISKESEFEKPDNLIGNHFSNQWEDEVTAACSDPDYLRKADPDEVAVTAAVGMMIPWQV